jgi:hypothetical protein
MIMLNLKELKKYLVIFVALIYVTLIGFAAGYVMDKADIQNELDRQTVINTQLELEYSDLKNAYDYLELSCKN